ncbi:hypothetical protein EU245_13230 [Lentibacillus lipolyticus]|nr:hypothetical protein EU245_13230 [Lentibacillus lipolyticus]
MKNTLIISVIALFAVVAVIYVYQIQQQTTFGEVIESHLNQKEITKLTIENRETDAKKVIEDASVIKKLMEEKSMHVKPADTPPLLSHLLWIKTKEAETEVLIGEEFLDIEGDFYKIQGENHLLKSVKEIEKAENY